MDAYGSIEEKLNSEEMLDCDDSTLFTFFDELPSEDEECDHYSGHFYDPDENEFE